MDIALLSGSALLAICWGILRRLVDSPHPTMTSSNGNIFRLTGPLCREFTGHRWNPPNKGQWRGALIIFFYRRLNNRLSKQSRRRWFETPLRSLRRHCNIEPVNWEPFPYHDVIMHYVQLRDCPSRPFVPFSLSQKPQYWKSRCLAVCDALGMDDWSRSRQGPSGPRGGPILRKVESLVLTCFFLNAKIGKRTRFIICGARTCFWFMSPWKTKISEFVSYQWITLDPGTIYIPDLIDTGSIYCNKIYER